MGMTRRGFLGRMAAAVASASVLAVDPERLLWVPGEKKIFDLGSARKIETPTINQTLHITQTQRGWQAGLVRMPATAYVADRYFVALSDGTGLTFDSNDELISAGRGGRALSDQEKAQIAVQWKKRLSLPASGIIKTGA